MDRMRKGAGFPTIFPRGDCGITIVVGSTWPHLVARFGGTVSQVGGRRTKNFVAQKDIHLLFI
jgi:hypothetical protein